MKKKELTPEEKRNNRICNMVIGASVAVGAAIGIAAYVVTGKVSKNIHMKKYPQRRVITSWKDATDGFLIGIQETGPKGEGDILGAVEYSREVIPEVVKSLTEEASAFEKSFDAIAEVTNG